MSSPEKSDEIVIAVREMATQPCVRSLEHRYHADWDELGIFITVHDGSRDSEVIRLSNALLAYLNENLPKGSSPFSWQVQVRRQGKVIDVLFPGDTTRKASALRNREQK